MNKEINKQIRQCTYNATFWNVMVRIVAVKKQQSFPYFIVELHCAVNNTKVLSSDVEIQQRSFCIFVLQSTTCTLLCLDTKCPTRF